MAAHLANSFLLSDQLEALTTVPVYLSATIISSTDTAPTQDLGRGQWCLPSLTVMKKQLRPRQHQAGHTAGGNLHLRVCALTSLTVAQDPLGDRDFVNH